MKRVLVVGVCVAVWAGTAFASEAASGEQLYKRCIRCHGFQADKSALGWSDAIGGWNVEKLEGALKGYRSGSYGGRMKGVMEEQAAALGDEDIRALSEYISSLKAHAPAPEEPLPGQK